MGSSGSREIVLPGSQAALPGAGTDEATRRRTDESFRSAETAIYQEGYRQGASEAHARLTEGAELAVKAAISRTLVEREGGREQELVEAIAELRKSQYRAPQRPLECQAEEAAVLACHAPSDCAPIIDSYVKCARSVVDSRMSPKLG